MRWTRAVIAAALGMVYPGLGHIYLREWIRAVSWFLIAILAAVLVMPPEFVDAVEAEGLSMLLESGQYMTFEAVAALFAIRVLNAVDAAILAVKPPEEEEESREDSCPNCGGDLDADLDFCPWCTMRFEQPDPE